MIFGGVVHVYSTDMASRWDWYERKWRLIMIFFYRYVIPMGLVLTEMAFDNDIPSRWDWYERKWRLIMIFFYQYVIPMGLVRTDMAFDNGMSFRWVTDMPSRWDWYEQKCLFFLPICHLLPICHPDGIGINGNGV
jgi:hypothetical protein